MMKVVQSIPPPAPILRIDLVGEGGSTLSTETHRSVTLDTATDFTDSKFQYSFDAEDALTALEDGGNLDLSQPPRVLPADGFTGSVLTRFRYKGRNTQRYGFDFGNQGTSATSKIFKEFVGGTYAKYAFDIIDALISATGAEPEIYDAANNYDRNPDAAWPHEATTGIVWSSGWGTQGQGGRRFALITPRHLIGPAHYSTPIPNGTDIHFKDVDSNIVTRQIAGHMRLDFATSGVVTDERYGLLAADQDLMLWVLDSDVPASITPLPIVGDWYCRFDQSTRCIQGMQLVHKSNGGKVVPTMTYEMADFGAAGISGTWRGESISQAHYKARHQWYPSTADKAVLGYGSEWFPTFIPGDSGSPIITPVAAGAWAYLGCISSTPMVNEAICNHWISVLDALVGSASGHTVTVAPDPTL